MITGNVGRQLAFLDLNGPPIGDVVAAVLLHRGDDASAILLHLLIITGRENIDDDEGGHEGSPE